MFFIAKIKQPFEALVLLLGSIKMNKTRKFLLCVLLLLVLTVLGKARILPTIIAESRKITRAIEGIPNPTKENTYCPNTYILIDAEDWYFKHFFHEPERARFMRAIFKFIIILYHYDLPWRLKIDEVFKYIKNQNWVTPVYSDEIKDVWRWWREDETKPFPWEYEPETVGKL